VLHASRFHVLPWNKHGGKLLNAHIPALGCLQLIVARKRTIPLTLNPMKQSKNKPRIRQAVGATRQCRKPQA
ncbi:SAM-dependent methyltransferase, partial [Shigella dysenteriae]